MSTPTFFGGKIYKPLDSNHDLSKGEISYLKEHGITKEQFDKMDAISQNEWLEECKNPVYESLRKLK